MSLNHGDEQPARFHFLTEEIVERYFLINISLKIFAGALILLYMPGLETLEIQGLQ